MILYVMRYVLERWDLYATMIATIRLKLLYCAGRRPRPYWDSGSYSISPSMLIRPFLIFSPLARNRSSTVLSLPDSVLSCALARTFEGEEELTLNQPIWSAMRCLKSARVLRHC